MSIPEADIPQNAAKSITIIELSSVDLNTLVDLLAIAYVLAPIQRFNSQDSSVQK